MKIHVRKRKKNSLILLELEENSKYKIVKRLKDPISKHFNQRNLKQN